MKRKQLGAPHSKHVAIEELLAIFEPLRFGVLATSDDGRPYTSLMAFVVSQDHRTVIFATPKNTRKYRNINNEPAVSILLDNRSQRADDLNSAQAVTLIGTAREVRTTAQMAEYRATFVDKHPELAAFIGEPGTAIIAVTIRQAVHVARFQDVSLWP
jgi:heme iron utilization protein